MLLQKQFHMIHLSSLKTIISFPLGVSISRLKEAKYSDGYNSLSETFQSSIGYTKNFEQEIMSKFHVQEVNYDR